MTTIAALATADAVYMAADSRTTAGSAVYDLPGYRKLFGCGELHFGWAGRCRDLEILQHGFTPPLRDEGITDLVYLSRDVTRSMRQLLSDAGSLEKQSEVESAKSHGLIAYRGRLYDMDPAFSVSLAEPYRTAGSGMYIALGALAATAGVRSFQADPEARVMAAVAAAIRHDPHTGGEVVVYIQQRPSA